MGSMRFLLAGFIYWAAHLRQDRQVAVGTFGRTRTSLGDLRKPEKMCPREALEALRALEGPSNVDAEDLGAAQRLERAEGDVARGRARARLSACRGGRLFRRARHPRIPAHEPAWTDPRHRR